MAQHGAVTGEEGPALMAELDAFVAKLPAELADEGTNDFTGVAPIDMSTALATYRQKRAPAPPAARVQPAAATASAPMPRPGAGAAPQMVQVPLISKTKGPKAPKPSKGKSAEGPPFPCEWEGCDRTFPTRRNRTDHYKKHRKKAAGPQLECEHPGCGKKFVFRVQLKRHMHTHSDEFPYTCEAKRDGKPCGKKFKDQQVYLAHVRAHSRPFICPQDDCGKRFGWSVDLKRHIEKLHKRSHEEFPGCANILPSSTEQYGRITEWTLRKAVANGNAEALLQSMGEDPAFVLAQLHPGGGGGRVGRSTGSAAHSRATKSGADGSYDTMYVPRIASGSSGIESAATEGAFMLHTPPHVKRARSEHHPAGQAKRSRMALPGARPGATLSPDDLRRLDQEANAIAAVVAAAQASNCGSASTVTGAVDSPPGSLVGSYAADGTSLPSTRAGVVTASSVNAGSGSGSGAGVGMLPPSSNHRFFARSGRTGVEGGSGLGSGGSFGRSVGRAGGIVTHGASGTPSSGLHGGTVVGTMPMTVGGPGTNNLLHHFAQSANQANALRSLGTRAAGPTGVGPGEAGRYAAGSRGSGGSGASSGNRGSIIAPHLVGTTDAAGAHGRSSGSQASLESLGLAGSNMIGELYSTGGVAAPHGPFAALQGQESSLDSSSAGSLGMPWPSSNGMPVLSSDIVSLGSFGSFTFPSGPNMHPLSSPVGFPFSPFGLRYPYPMSATAAGGTSSYPMWTFPMESPKLAAASIPSAQQATPGSPEAGSVSPEQSRPPHSQDV